MEHCRAIAFILSALACLAGCTATEHRVKADRVAKSIIGKSYKGALGRTMVEPPAPTTAARDEIIMKQNLPRGGEASLGLKGLAPMRGFPEKERKGPIVIGDAGNSAEMRPLINIAEALRLAAAGNRDYQTQKATLISAALSLDTARNTFRNNLTLAPTAQSKTDRSTATHTDTGTTENEATWSKKLTNGAALAGTLALDISKAFTPKGATSMGLVSEPSITIPLLRGSGKLIAMESLTQAERNMVYAINAFEVYKLTFAIGVYEDYLAVLRQQAEVQNQEDNYRRLQETAEKSEALAKAGRMTQVALGQNRQNELSARSSWISAKNTYANLLDSFKVKLGLPPDARIELASGELETLGSRFALCRVADFFLPLPLNAGDSENKPGTLVNLAANLSGDPGLSWDLRLSPAEELALKNRLEIRTKNSRVDDARRAIIVAADNLRPKLNILGTGNFTTSWLSGHATEGFAPRQGNYVVKLDSSFPFNRTSERNSYREAWLDLETAIRNAQESEDAIKLEVRNAARNYRKAFENHAIQLEAVKLAEARVDSVSLFFAAGRAEMRDLLDARSSLVDSRSELSSAVVALRQTELEWERVLGLLTVDNQGMTCMLEQPSPALANAGTTKSWRQDLRTGD